MLKEHRTAIRLFNSLLEAVFPTKCLACHSFFKPASSGRYLLQSFDDIISDVESYDQITFSQVLSSFICAECISEFVPVVQPFCTTCGIMDNSDRRSPFLCSACSYHPRQFRMARSYGVYGTVLEKLIHQYKYQRRLQLAKPFGILTFLTFLTYWNPADIDMIIPIPLHLKKLRQRGFNQSCLMIRKWFLIAQKLKIDISHIQLVPDRLVRSRYTQSQIGMSRQQRQINIQNAFEAPEPGSVRGKYILLIDDVLTTGSTTNECARILLNCGARRVDVLTLAQTVIGN